MLMLLSGQETLCSLFKASYSTWPACVPLLSRRRDLIGSLAQELVQRSTRRVLIGPQFEERVQVRYRLSSSVLPNM